MADLSLDEALNQLVRREAAVKIETGPIPGEDVQPKKDVPPTDPGDPSGEKLAADAGSRTDMPATSKEDEQGTTEGSPDKKTIEDDPEQDPDGPSVAPGPDSSKRDDAASPADVTLSAETLIRSVGNVRQLLRHQAGVEVLAVRYMYHRAEVDEEAVKEKTADVKQKLQVSEEDAEAIAKEIVDGNVDEAEVEQAAQAVQGLKDISTDMETPPAEVARVASVIGMAAMHGGNASSMVNDMRKHILQTRAAGVKDRLREAHAAAKAELGKAKKEGDEFDIRLARRHMASVNDQIDRLFGRVAREDTGNATGTVPEVDDTEEAEEAAATASAVDTPGEAGDVAAEQAADDEAAQEETEEVDGMAQDPEQLAAVLLADEAADDEVAKAAEVVKKLQGGMDPAVVAEAVMERAANVDIDIDNITRKAHQDMMSITPKQFVHLYLDAQGYPVVRRKRG